ncbi:MAG: DsbC family protein [Desulfobacterales bacterium]|nr:DsbC family protein [Desulfobacterales bacterium]
MNIEKKENGSRRPHEIDKLSVLILASFLAFLVLAGPFSPAMAECPPAERLKADIERVTNQKTEIVAIRPSAVPSLCEVVVFNGSQNGIFYTDTTGELFIFGNLIEAADGNNLTRQTLAEFNRLTDREMEELSFFTAFSIGDESATVLYYVTDPQCPYCKRGEEDLKKLAAEGKLHARFLLFPLASHEGAFEQCVSVVCDGKGLEDFENGYRSENQCEDGRLLVESGVDFLKKKGVQGTPTYIFGDGRFHSGFLKMPDLLKRLNASQPRSETSGAGPAESK